MPFSGQRIEDIARHVDYISSMIYPTTFIPGNLGFDEPAHHPYETDSTGWLFWNAGGKYEEAVFEADPYHRLERIPLPPEQVEEARD